MDIVRANGRPHEQMRPVVMETDFTKWAEGAVLCGFGDTRVLCTASVEERLPGWLKETRGQGWVTAEYSMLPRSTDRRTQRESVQGKIGGRTHEISRLIGRALRGVVELKKLGERTITLDCDVLQADGGTRTAAITGAFVAMSIAIRRMLLTGRIDTNPIKEQVAAVSLGASKGAVLLDLDYKEDQNIDVDLNLVMTSSGGIIEIQGTGEKAPLDRKMLDRMLELGGQAMAQLFEHQRAAVARTK